MQSIHYNDNVFINCPFDSAYKHLFDAMVFAIHDCGFIPRCALEEEDASEVRIDKIYNIIADCRYGIHDISRTELGQLPKSKDLGLCEAYTERPLHKLNSFLQSNIAVSVRGSISNVSDTPLV